MLTRFFLREMMVFVEEMKKTLWQIWGRTDALDLSAETGIYPCHQRNLFGDFLRCELIMGYCLVLSLMARSKQQYPQDILPVSSEPCR